MIGRSIEAVLLVEFWHHDTLRDPANTLHLKVSGQPWLQASFDGGDLYWRTAGAPPDAFDVPEEGWSYRVADVGADERLVGARVAGVFVGETEAGSELRLELGEGRCLCYRTAHDERQSVAVRRAL